MSAGKPDLKDTEHDLHARICLAFTGGGTGGHIYPGLAVIEALRRAGFQGRIVWLGSEKELDRRIVTEAGIEYFAIPSGKFRRSLDLRNLSDLTRIAAGYFASRSILRQIAPALLFSKGGYVSVPPCCAAASLGIPVFTHESDTTPGLATRLNARVAEKILTSWEGTATFLPEGYRHKVIRTGNPVRRSLFEGDANRGRTLLGIPDAIPVVLVLGGSQGAQEVNRLVLDALPLLEGRCFVVHQTGTEHYQEVVATARSRGVSDQWYRAMPYIGSELPDIMAAASVLAGRAGAGSVWEAASLLKPMVLVPLSGIGTRGDQVENAAAAQAAGAARSLTGPDVHPQAFAAAVLHYLKDAQAYDAARNACRHLTVVEQAGSGHAADFIANLILARIGWKDKSLRPSGMKEQSHERA